MSRGRPRTHALVDGTGHPARQVGDVSAVRGGCRWVLAAAFIAAAMPAPAERNVAEWFGGESGARYGEVQGAIERAAEAALAARVPEELLVERLAEGAAKGVAPDVLRRAVEDDAAALAALAAILDGRMPRLDASARTEALRLGAIAVRGGIGIGTVETAVVRTIDGGRDLGRTMSALVAAAALHRGLALDAARGLALAEAVGARCCVDIAGSFSPTSWFGPHPENLSERFFDAAVENARKILDAVKPTRTTFCYEMMAWSLPDSPDACLRLVKAVDRPAFAVHLDPCNLVSSPERYYRSADLVRESYAKLGPRIASVHVKDLAWEVEMAVHFREVRPGQGSIDHAAWLVEHARHCPDVPLMLEHLPSEAEYDAARDHVRGAGERVGLRFE